MAMIITSCSKADGKVEDVSDASADSAAAEKTVEGDAEAVPSVPELPVDDAEATAETK